MVVTQAKKTTKVKYCVGNGASDLIDHQSFNFAKLVSVGTADNCSFNLVTTDQIMHV